MLSHKVLAVVAVLGMIAWSLQAIAEEGGTHKAESHAGHAGHEGISKVQITGEVIDIVCFTRHDSRGKKHIKCAEYCAGLGIPMGILDAKTGKIYMVFPEGHSNPNTKVMPYIGKQVKVVGEVHEKGGLSGITIEKIEEIKG